MDHSVELLKMKIDSLNGTIPNYRYKYSYWVSVTDANGCKAFKTFNLKPKEYYFFIKNNFYDTRLASYGKADGRIAIKWIFTDQGAKNADNYTYQWSHDATLNKAIADSLATGKYTVTVTSEAGCSTVKTFTVTEEKVCQDE